MEGKPRKVLIADDEPDILEIISYNLGKEGYEVYTARDGNEAIERAKLLLPDLIILDQMMPRSHLNLPLLSRLLFNSTLARMLLTVARTERMIDLFRVSLFVTCSFARELSELRMFSWCSIRTCGIGGMAISF